MNMIYFYIFGLFLLASVSIYAVIQSRTNRWITFFLVPLILCMSLFTWQAIVALQGTPIAGSPDDKDIEVMWVHNEKPVILLILKIPGEDIPKYHYIPWSEQNSREAREMGEKMEQGIPVTGEFKKLQEGYTGKSGDIIFSPVERFSNDNLKNNSH